MAVNLIRKNNQENVTAYEDTVLFHLIKGENGVLPGVGDLFALSYDATTQKMTVNSGMGMVYGRQFEIKEGEEVEMDWSALTGIKYISVYVEVDLRDPTNETATFKSTYAASAYPTVAPGNNLISTTTGVARMLMFWVYRSSTGQMTITNKHTTYRNNWIANANFATNADFATSATNSTQVGNNTITNSSALRVTRNGQSVNEIIETKRILFSGSQVLYNTASKGTTISLSASVSNGDMLEFVYSTQYYSGIVLEHFTVIRVQVASGFVTLVGVDAGRTRSSGFTATSDTFQFSGSTMTYKGGYYLLNWANNGGTALENNTIRLTRVYKIIGGNA